jgi:hypothetical protein
VSKAHAERNERVSKLLHEGGTYFDWVVTTAFYSALHYVQNEIFPLSDGRDNYISFDNYYNRVHRGVRKPKKHQAIISLVAKEIPPVGAKYRFLHDNSYTARYRNYAIPEAIANQAQEYLQDIKENCAK